MSNTTIAVPEELADELYRRKERGDTYADVIRRLIEKADAPEAGGQGESDGTDERQGGEEPIAGRQNGTGEASDRQATHDDDRAGVDVEGEAELADVDPQVWATVERVAGGEGEGGAWSDGEARLQARKRAAAAVLQYAIDTGEAVGKTDAVDGFADEYPVEGQESETWWRKNVRPVLKTVGTYSNGAHGYRVTTLPEA